MAGWGEMLSGLVPHFTRSVGSVNFLLLQENMDAFLIPREWMVGNLVNKIFQSFSSLLDKFWIKQAFI
eukprot:m.82633 g.82633  ORF g.82633 m.82633 type:complete len:68 (-) comp8671_c0_seq1:341-544(-)